MDSVDFLAISRPSTPGKELRIIVEVAFRTVHGCADNKAIASRLGISGPALNGIWNRASDVTPGTIRKILGHFESPEIRRRIVAAWEADSLGGPMASSDRESWEGDILKHIQNLRWSRQPERALRAAREAMEAAADPTEWLQLAEIAIALSFQLDMPVEQADLAVRIRSRGRESRDLGIEAKAMAFTARMLRRCGAPRKTVIEIRRIVLGMTGDAGRHSSTANHLRFARDIVESENAHDMIELHEAVGGKEQELQALLKLADDRVARTSSAGGVTQALILKAWLHLALGDSREAEKTLEQAFNANRDGLSNSVKVGVLGGRVLAARGETEAAIEYYERFSMACLRERELYLHRIVQRELARLIAAS